MNRGPLAFGAIAVIGLGAISLVIIGVENSVQSAPKPPSTEPTTASGQKSAPPNQTDRQPQTNCGEQRIVGWHDEKRANRYLDRGFHIQEVKQNTYPDGEYPDGEKHIHDDSKWVLKKTCDDQ